MGTRTPPRRRFVLDPVPSEEAADGADPPTGREARALLNRIADALQVPTSALYRPPNAVNATKPDAGLAPRPHPALACECAALVDAYQRIRDPDVRRRLLALVQEAAEPA